MLTFVNSWVCIKSFYSELGVSSLQYFEITTGGTHVKKVFFAITYLFITDRLNRNWRRSWWNRTWLKSNLLWHCVRKRSQWSQLSTCLHLWLKIHSTSTPNLLGLPNTGSHKMYRVAIKQDTGSPPQKQLLSPRGWSCSEASRRRYCSVWLRSKFVDVEQSEAASWLD